jgi:uroporphyrinogen-III synthase
MIVAGRLDAVSFTSAPAVVSLLQRAKALGCLTELVAAMRTRVTAVCVGPVTAAPLRSLDIPAVYPDRYRLGALARLITDEIPNRAPQFAAGGHAITVHSGTVSVDGQVRAIPPAGMALLRRLIDTSGRVVSRDELLTQLPGGGADRNAVDAAMARLRSALGAPAVIQTVVKRGYRLATDPAQGRGA